jgi:hypothetical protein
VKDFKSIIGEDEKILVQYIRKEIPAKKIKLYGKNGEEILDGNGVPLFGYIEGTGHELVLEKNLELVKFNKKAIKRLPVSSGDYLRISKSEPVGIMVSVGLNKVGYAFVSSKEKKMDWKFAKELAYKRATNPEKYPKPKYFPVWFEDVLGDFYKRTERYFK